MARRRRSLLRPEIYRGRGRIRAACQAIFAARAGIQRGEATGADALAAGVAHGEEQFDYAEEGNRSSSRGPSSTEILGTELLTSGVERQYIKATEHQGGSVENNRDAQRAPAPSSNLRVERRWSRTMTRGDHWRRYDCTQGGRRKNKSVDLNKGSAKPQREVWQRICPIIPQQLVCKGALT